MIMRACPSELSLFLNGRLRIKRKAPSVQIYNRQNELCIFLKRKVHFFDTFSHENEQLISQLLIFYNRAFSTAFQAYFNALSMSFQIQCKSVEPQKSFSKTNQA